MGRGIGGTLCVALPFILTAVSLVCLLIVGLSGVTGSTLSIFEIQPKELSISLEDLQELKIDGSKLNIDEDILEKLGFDDEIDAAIDQYGGVNITAKKLGLADKYNFYVWNFVEVRGDKTTKSKAEFDYAQNFTNIDHIGNINENENGVEIQIPDVIEDGLQVFATLMKWSQIAYVIAVVAAGVTLLVGISSFFSRIGSFITWICSFVALAGILAFAVLTTVTSTGIVGILKAAAEDFGVKSSVSTSWLAVTWIGVAAAMASGLFWLFSICCCKGSNGGRKNKRTSLDDSNEKLVGSEQPRGYQQVHDPFQTGQPQQSGYTQPQFSIPMGNVKTSRAQAYEPYSHHST